MSGFFRVSLLWTCWICAMTPTYACSRPSDITEADDFKRASYVFHALLVETKLSDVADQSAGTEEGSRVVHGRYELKTLIKGDAPASGLVTTSTGIIGGCALPLLAGQEYIFFVDPWPEETSAELKQASLGTVSIFGSHLLTGYEPKTQEELQRLRMFDKK